MIAARTKDSRTSQNGSSIAEFGPVLFILLIMIAFPLIDLLAVALFYNAGSVLNGSQVREAALEPYTQVNSTSGFVKQAIVDQWIQGGLGRFCKLAQPVDTQVIYKTGVAGDKIVVLTTSIVVSPLVNIGIPFLPGVPGINAPVPFSYTSEHVVENPENAP